MTKSAAPDPGVDEKRCPRCERGVVMRLHSMSKYSALTWFKCANCDHVFTETPAPRGDSAGATTS